MMMTQKEQLPVIFGVAALITAVLSVFTPAILLAYFVILGVAVYLVYETFVKRTIEPTFDNILGLAIAISALGLLPLLVKSFIVMATFKVMTYAFKLFIIYVVAPAILLLLYEIVKDKLGNYRKLVEDFGLLVLAIAYIASVIPFNFNTTLEAILFQAVLIISAGILLAGLAEERT